MSARVALAALLLLGSGCRAGTSPSVEDAASDDVVVVASFNFSESELVAEMYALALEEAGVAVRRELGLGPRELVVPALRQRLVDVVPEYLGTALSAAAPRSVVVRTDPAAVHRALTDAVEPWGLRVLDSADAQNQNAFVVTSETQERYDLSSISDLAPLAATLVIGGPPECVTRPYCLVGLSEVYGLEFADFLPLVGQRRVEQALLDGVVDVGVLFTTDGVLAGDRLRLLEDDRSLQPAENLAPLVRADVLDRDDRVEAVLDDVSARLSTATLRFLNWRVTVAGNDPTDEARAWLVRQRLIPR